jgi:hypothetical protein
MTRLEAATAIAVAAAVVMVVILVAHAANGVSGDQANAVVDALMDCALFGEEGDHCEARDGR